MGEVGPTLRRASICEYIKHQFQNAKRATAGQFIINKNRGFWIARRFWCCRKPVGHQIVTVSN